MLVIVSIDLIIIVIGSAIPQSRLIATKKLDVYNPQMTTVCVLFLIVQLRYTTQRCIVNSQTFVNQELMRVTILISSCLPGTVCPSCNILITYFI